MVPLLCKIYAHTHAHAHTTGRDYLLERTTDQNVIKLSILVLLQCRSAKKRTCQSWKPSKNTFLHPHFWQKKKNPLFLPMEISVCCVEVDSKTTTVSGIRSSTNTTDSKERNEGSHTGQKPPLYANIHHLLSEVRWRSARRNEPVKKVRNIFPKEMMKLMFYQRPWTSTSKDLQSQDSSLVLEINSEEKHH